MRKACEPRLGGALGADLEGSRRMVAQQVRQAFAHQPRRAAEVRQGDDQLADRIGNCRCGCIGRAALGHGKVESGTGKSGCGPRALAPNFQPKAAQLTEERTIEVQLSKRGETKGRRVARSYDSVAWCYDEIAAFYSLGGIGRAKASQVLHIEPGERVFYAGVGRGREAVLAAQRGAILTGLDAAPAMLSRLQRNLLRAGAAAELVCGDFFDHVPAAPYDVAVANFFLNVFSPCEMRRALAHLVSLVAPGGRVMIADFAPPRGSLASRLACRAYYRPVSLAAFATGLAALHPIYDYEREFEGLGLRLIRRDEFRLPGWLPTRGGAGRLARSEPSGRMPVVFQSIVARRC